jgi:hypothetical protein
MQLIEAALRQLYDASYSDGRVTIDQATHSVIVTSVEPKALQAVGA